MASERGVLGNFRQRDQGCHPITSHPIATTAFCHSRTPLAWTACQSFVSDARKGDQCGQFIGCMWGLAPTRSSDRGQMQLHRPVVGLGGIRLTSCKLANQTGSWRLAVISFKSPVFCGVWGWELSREFLFVGIGLLRKFPCLVCLVVCCDCTGPVSMERKVLFAYLSEEEGSCADDELGLWS